MKSMPSRPSKFSDREAATVAGTNSMVDGSEFGLVLSACEQADLAILHSSHSRLDEPVTRLDSPESC